MRSPSGSGSGVGGRASCRSPESYVPFDNIGEAIAWIDDCPDSNALDLSVNCVGIYRGIEQKSWNLILKTKLEVLI